MDAGFLQCLQRYALMNEEGEVIPIRSTNRDKVWGLPFELFNEEVGMDIRNRIGTVVAIDCKSLASDQARFLRIRVEVPLDKLLRRGASILSPEGDKVWVAFQYERLDLDISLHVSCVEQTWVPENIGHNPVCPGDALFSVLVQYDVMEMGTIQTMHNHAMRSSTPIEDHLQAHSGTWKRLDRQKTNPNPDVVHGIVDEGLKRRY
nr:hypothetical protein CFP56_15748 [Quercus suber]